ALPILPMNCPPSTNAPAPGLKVMPPNVTPANASLLGARRVVPPKERKSPLTGEAPPQFGVPPPVFVAGLPPIQGEQSRPGGGGIAQPRRCGRGGQNDGVTPI